VTNLSIRLLYTFLDYYSQGKLDPLTERKVFKASDIEQAFRHLQNGSHMGKVVIAMGEDDSSVAIAVPEAKRIEFDAKGSYILTGGLGGLGKSMATWLVEHGAKSLIFLSRSAGLTDESKETIKELASMGCSVSTVSGKAENMDDVKAAIASSSLPIKGVFHLAMVLRVSP
jgi:D-arabinose 1-dehydrogenase-like Zn-dependent alcohol dehydrogenase